MNRTSLVLISGAIADIHKEAHIIELKGTPLILKEGSNPISKLKKTQINLVIRNLLKIFKNKEQKPTPIINELNESMITEFTNLQHKEKTPIIISWNGQTDMGILNRLNIKHTVLSIRAYDVHNDGIFYLQIINLHTKQTRTTRTSTSTNTKKKWKTTRPDGNSQLYLTDNTQ